LGISNSCGLVSISISNNLSSFSLCFLNDLCFNQSGLSNDLIVLQVGFSIYSINECLSLGLPFTSNSLCGSLDIFNFFSFLHLLKICFLVLILSLFFFDLSCFGFFFHIILNSLLECKLLSFKSIFELENSLFLH